MPNIQTDCFAPKTKVWCSTGHYRTIEELAKADRAFITDGFDESQNAFVTDRAVAYRQYKTARLMAVTYTIHGTKDRDVTVRCTPNHKFRICLNAAGPMPDYKNRATCWLEAEHLEPNRQLVAKDAYITVKETKYLTEQTEVYNITVRDGRSYAIEGGVIVHT